MNPPIARRPLGRTGHQTSIFALGGVCYNFLSDADAAALVHRALDLGINYIDTAYSYKDSERKIGLVLAERRKEAFVATKTTKRLRAEAAAEIEESLKRLRTDVIDCLQLHCIQSEEEWAQVTGPGGALEAIEEFKRAGHIRFVGITSHVDPTMLAKAMEEYPFDVMLVSLGPVHSAVRPFYDTVMPVAQRRGVGVLCMKAMGSGFMKDHVEMSLRYSMGLPGVTAAVVGVDNIQQLEQNAAIAREFKALSPEEEGQLMTTARQIYEQRKADAWFVKMPAETAS